ncbi:MAG: hypothetical protein LUE92_17290, partial [Clostridiales bacterium]|nr:hypothetical protein [Clostridiales bacterium]
MRYFGEYICGILANIFVIPQQQMHKKAIIKNNNRPALGFLPPDTGPIPTTMYLWVRYLTASKDL